MRMMSMRSAGIVPRGRARTELDDDVPDFAHLKKSQRLQAEPVVTQVTPRRRTRRRQCAPAPR